MKTDLYRSLPAKERAIVAAAVLLDGREAENYLGNDISLGQKLSQAAIQLATIPIDIRMPLVGALLRAALNDIAAEKLAHNKF